jgi:hypothetical protein
VDEIIVEDDAPPYTRMVEAGSQRLRDVVDICNRIVSVEPAPADVIPFVALFVEKVGTSAPILIRASFPLIAAIAVSYQAVA